MRHNNVYRNLCAEVVYKPHWKQLLNCNLFKKRNIKSKQHKLKCICKFYNYFTSNNLIINTIIITIPETYQFLSLLESIHTMAGAMNCQTLKYLSQGLLIFRFPLLLLPSNAVPVWSQGHLFIEQGPAPGPASQPLSAGEICATEVKYTTILTCFILTATVLLERGSK